MKSQDAWIKRFDEKFNIDGDGYGMIQTYPEDVKAFITHELDVAREEERERTIKWMNEQGYEGLQKEYVVNLAKKKG